MSKILISGASGLIGSELSRFLTQAGYDVRKLVRKKENVSTDEISWNPEKGELDEKQLEDINVIINLAGENVASGRWTKIKKEKILNSRVDSTRTLVNAISRMKNTPQLFINASAVGYYGDCGDILLTEQSANGNGFLAQVCAEWEKAAEPVTKKGTRLAITRFGAVLSPKGGALAKMLMPFKLGLGGVIGSGKQYVSWVTLDEVLGIIYHIIHTSKLQGSINVVAPDVITNETLTKTLGKVLSRPTILPLPAAAARLVFGEMATETLLSSQRASCWKLIDSGYQFCQPDLESALRQMLSK